jgi:hypothetical protein
VRDGPSPARSSTAKRTLVPPTSASKMASDSSPSVTLPPICTASTADRDRSRGGHENDTALGAAGPLWSLGFAQNRRPVHGYDMAASEVGVEICQSVALRGVYKRHPDTAARLAVVLQ